MVLTLSTSKYFLWKNKLPRVPETKDLLSYSRCLQSPHPSISRQCHHYLEGPLPFALPKSFVNIIVPAWPPFEKQQKSGLLEERYSFTWNDASEDADPLDTSKGLGERKVTFLPSPCVFSFTLHHVFVNMCIYNVHITEFTYAVPGSTQALCLLSMMQQVGNGTPKNLRCREV